MNRILTCPHCGPTLTEARLRCDRCGRELVYIDEYEFTGGQREVETADPSRPAAWKRAGLWLGVTASAAVVFAMAGLLRPGRQAPAMPVPAAPAVLVQSAPSAMPVPPADPAGRGGASEPDTPEHIFKPGDLSEALEHYRAALAEKPTDPELLDNVGRILVAMNKPAEAVPFLEQALTAEPFSIVARFDLAVAYAQSGKAKEAVEHYEALVKADSADPRVYHNLGLALRQLGRNADAAVAFERAATLDPGRAPVWLGLALSLEADGRGGEAVTALEQYLALEPAGADADNVRARIARLRAAAEPSAAVADGEGASSRRCP